MFLPPLLNRASPYRPAVAPRRRPLLQLPTLLLRLRPSSRSDVIVPAPPPPMFPAQPGHRDMENKWEQVLGMCRAALNEFGNESPRFKYLHGRGVASRTHLLIQDDVFRNNLQNPATIRGYLRDLEGLRQWAMSIGSPISMLRDLDVAAFLRDSAARGSSVPNRLLHTLVWFEKAFGFALPTSSPLVRNQSHPPDRLPAAPPQGRKTGFS